MLSHSCAEFVRDEHTDNAFQDIGLEHGKRRILTAWSSRICWMRRSWTSEESDLKHCDQWKQPLVGEGRQRRLRDRDFLRGEGRFIITAELFPQSIRTEEWRASQRLCQSLPLLELNAFRFKAYWAI